MLTPREQGDFGELSAMCWLASRGASVAIPVGNNRHWDLVAELDGRVLRVQVKTSRSFRLRRWEVRVSTSGGNQSWNRVIKLLDPSRFDRLFVLVGDGRRWFIPAERIEPGALCVWAVRNTPSSRSNPATQSPAARSKRPPLQSPPDQLGGMSERPKEWRCKRHGSAYAGSNPAPPTPRDAPVRTGASFC
jgi:PD-(D/E)XK endonuclease